MTAHALSQAIHVPATRVNDIVNGKRGITVETALRLARYFGNSPEFWLVGPAPMSPRPLPPLGARRPPPFQTRLFFKQFEEMLSDG